MIRRRAWRREMRRRTRRPRLCCRAARRRGGDAPAPFARIGLAAGRAALDDDQGIMRGEASALDLGIVAAGQHRGFFAVGKEHAGAARPGEEILRPRFAQEFRRSRIDPDRPTAGARQHARHRRARPGRKEAVARQMNCRRSVYQRVGNIARGEARLAPRSVRKLRSPLASTSAISRPVWRLRRPPDGE